MFKKNLDLPGRVIRATLGLILITIGLFLKSWSLSLIALFVLIEALMSWCILFAFLGINKCKIKK